MQIEDDKASVQNTVVGHSSDLNISTKEAKKKKKKKKKSSVSAESQGQAKVGRHNYTEGRTSVLSSQLPDLSQHFL